MNLTVNTSSHQNLKLFVIIVKPIFKINFRLRAVKESIKGPFSTEVCVVTDAAAPSTPDVPHLSNKTKTSLLLKWTVSLLI